MFPTNSRLVGWLLCALSGASGVLGSGSASAALESQPASQAPPSLRPLGSSASDAASELASAKRGSKSDAAAEVTFSGFRALPDGRSVVFVELSRPVTVEVSRAGQVIEYKLLDAKVPLRNNRNPLLLRDFGSSALSAVLVAGKKDVRLVITLRAPVTPTHQLVANATGAALEVALPAPPAG